MAALGHGLAAGAAHVIVSEGECRRVWVALSSGLEKDGVGSGHWGRSGSAELNLEARMGTKSGVRECLGEAHSRHREQQMQRP